MKEYIVPIDDLKAIIEGRDVKHDLEFIVRCKDCKYKCKTEDGEYYPEDIVCSYWESDGLCENDYCSYAEREDE